jgi:hypothetical protein
MLTGAWGIPVQVAGVPLSFEGFANYIGAKGNNEFGGGTAPETNIDMQIMYDMSAGPRPRTPSRSAWNTSTGKTSSATRTPTIQAQPPRRRWCAPNTTS